VGCRIHARRRPAVADVKYFEVEIHLVPLAKRQNLTETHIVTVEGGLPDIVLRQKRHAAAQTVAVIGEVAERTRYGRAAGRDRGVAVGSGAIDRRDRRKLVVHQVFVERAVPVSEGGSPDPG
jgi:hypothetical protein